MSLPLYPVTAGTVPAVPTAPTSAPPPTDDPSVPACSVLPCPTLRLSGASPSSDFFCPYTPRPSRQGSFKPFYQSTEKIRGDPSAAAPRVSLPANPRVLETRYLVIYDTYMYFSFKVPTEFSSFIFYFTFCTRHYV